MRSPCFEKQVEIYEAVKYDKVMTGMEAFPKELLSVGEVVNVNSQEESPEDISLAEIGLNRKSGSFEIKGQ